MAPAALTPRARRWASIVGLMALCTTAGVVLVPAAQPDVPDDEVRRDTEFARSPPIAAPTASSPTTAVLRLPEQARTAAAAAERTPTRLFAAHSWQPPAPPPKPPPPPPPPQAPAFPYAYFGGLDDERGRTGFFLQGQKVVAARVGERIGEFRLDAIDAQRATLTFLPLAQSQTVGLGLQP